ncbi:MAG: hypothetical protein ACLR5H_07240 [Oscillospiraceae bacterium]
MLPRPRGRGRRQSFPTSWRTRRRCWRRHRYDGLYRHHVEAQIHYANGELERYNNAMALWNNGLMTLRDHWCRGHMPRRQARALRLC